MSAYLTSWVSPGAAANFLQVSWTFTMFVATLSTYLRLATLEESLKWGMVKSFPHEVEGGTNL